MNLRVVFSLEFLTSLVATLDPFGRPLDRKCVSVFASLFHESCGCFWILGLL